MMLQATLLFQAVQDAGLPTEYLRQLKAELKTQRNRAQPVPWDPTPPVAPRKTLRAAPGEGSTHAGLCWLEGPDPSHWVPKPSVAASVEILPKSVGKPSRQAPAWKLGRRGRKMKPDPA